MKIIKKHTRRTVGKDTDKTAYLHKDIDILNYRPADYKYCRTWVDFYNSAEKYFRKTVANTTIDDLCDDMFDSLIESKYMEMLSLTKQEYTYHIETINHIRGMINGQLVKADKKIKALNKDIERFDKNLDEYLKIKSDNSIY